MRPCAEAIIEPGKFCCGFIDIGASPGCATGGVGGGGCDMSIGRSHGCAITGLVGEPPACHGPQLGTWTELGTGVETGGAGAARARARVRVL